MLGVYDCLCGARVIATNKARYSYTRLLLYRSFITQAKQFEELQDATFQYKSTASKSMFSECQLLCIDAAQEIISILFDHLPTRNAVQEVDVLPERWNMMACENQRTQITGT